MRLYEFGAGHAEDCGVILADTKFEFGEIDGNVLVIDEMMTPDSSRYWPADAYEVGGSPPSFDKQYVRDFMDATGLEPRTASRPTCRSDAIANTRPYREAYELITGELRRLVRPRRRLPRPTASWRRTDLAYAASSTGWEHGRYDGGMAAFEARVEGDAPPGIADPAGATVERALPALGYTNVSQVHIGKTIRLVVEADDAPRAHEVEEMCERLLANPVIEAYEVTISSWRGPR